jgi:hypothetical protein
VHWHQRLKFASSFQLSLGVTWVEIVPVLKTDSQQLKLLALLLMGTQKSAKQKQEEEK